MMKKVHEYFLRLTKLFDKPFTRQCFTTHNINDTASLMPESRGPPVLGMISWLVSSAGGTKLHEYVDQKHKELGPVYRDCVGPVRAVFINLPNEYRRIFRLEGPTPKHYLPEAFHLYNEIRNLRRGLLFMDGSEWLNHRRKLNKIFLTSDLVKTVGPPCQIAADLLVKRWLVVAENNTVIPNLEYQLYQWSIEVMLAVLIGPEAWTKNKKKMKNEAKKLAQYLHKVFFYSVRLSSIPAKLAMKLKIPWWTKYVKSIDESMEILKVLVPEMSNSENDGVIKKLMTEGIVGEDLFRIVADLIISAGDTTAYSIQWALFLLASHPDQQNKLYDIIKDLNQKELLRNQFLKGIIKESLRLYPTAPFITRFLLEDSKIAGYKVAKNELLLLSLYSSGRDPANFLRPNEFLPERWIRTPKGDYEGVFTPHATLPFAMGARSCIGRKLAETQLMMTLAELIKNYTIVCTNKENINMKLHLISVPSESIHLTLSKR